MGWFLRWGGPQLKKGFDSQMSYSVSLYHRQRGSDDYVRFASIARLSLRSFRVTYYNSGRWIRERSVPALRRRFTTYEAAERYACATHTLDADNPAVAMVRSGRRSAPDRFAAYLLYRH